MNERALLPRLARRALGGCLDVVQGVAFWSAVLLPLLYLPAFVLGHGALASPPAPEPVASLPVALLLAHGLALVVGHGHRAGGPAR